MTQRTTPPAPDYLTPGEAAAIAHVTVRTIHRYGTSGLLGFIKLPSGHRRYLREDVEALIKDAA